MDNSPKNSSNKSRNIILIVISSIVLLMLCCCGGYASIAVAAMRAVTEDSNLIQEDVLIPLCNNYPFLEDGEMDQYFSTKYTKTATDTKLFLSDIFPDSYECDDIYTNGVVDMVKKGQSVEIYSNLDGTFADLSMKTVNDQTFSVTLENDDDGKWRITSISVINTY